MCLACRSYCRPRCCSTQRRRSPPWSFSLSFSMTCLPASSSQFTDLRHYSEERLPVPARPPTTTKNPTDEQRPQLPPPVRIQTRSAIVHVASRRHILQNPAWQHLHDRSLLHL